MQYSIDEYSKHLDKLMQQISDAKFIFTCVSETHSRQVRRIFEDGQNTAGKTFQYDSTNPIYVNPETQSPKKFPPRGKSGQEYFKSGKKHKTGYFPSYKAFRAAIDRQTSPVNFRLTENLKLNFQNSLTLIDTRWVSGVNAERGNVGKVDGLESKYGVIFHLNTSEKDILKQCAKRKLIDTFNN